MKPLSLKLLRERISFELDKFRETAGANSSKLKSGFDPHCC